MNVTNMQIHDNAPPRRGFHIIPLAVTFLLIALLMLPLATHAAATATPPLLIVLPPANGSGTASNEWLSYGIQDAITVDLWQVSSVRTLPLTEYGAQRSYNMTQLRTSQKRAALEIARQVKADQVWFGEYSYERNDIIVLWYTAVDVKSGIDLHQQEVRGNLTEALALSSKLVTAMLPHTGFAVTDSQLKHISTPKSASFKAFEQNSLSFARQVQMFAKKGHKYVERISWAEHGKLAVTIDPTYAEAHINLGWAYFTDQLYDAALTSFTTALTLKPYLLDGWMGLGYVHRERGRKGMAIDAFQKAAALNPSLDWPQRELKEALSTTAKVTAKNTVLSSDKSYEAFESSLSEDEKTLLNQAENAPPDVQLNAISTLAATKGEAALPFLEQMINRPNQSFAVLKLMVDISIPRSTPYLAEALTKRAAPDGSRLSGLTEENIMGVLQLISRRSLQQTAPAVTGLLTDRSPAIRERAALLLADFGKTEALEPIKKMVAAEQNRLVRTSGLVALVALGDNEAKRRLEILFKSGDDKTVVNHAIKLLKQRKLQLGKE